MENTKEDSGTREYCIDYIDNRIVLINDKNFNYRANLPETLQEEFKALGTLFTQTSKGAMLVESGFGFR